MKKLLLIASVASFLSGCGEKDAKYYYEHPEEAKKVMTECQEKANKATIEQLDELANDKLCKTVATGVLGIRLGDLKKAIMVDDEQGWAGYIKYQKSSKKLAEMTKKIREEEKQDEDKNKQRSGSLNKLSDLIPNDKK